MKRKYRIIYSTNRIITFWDSEHVSDAYSAISSLFDRLRTSRAIQVQQDKYLNALYSYHLLDIGYVLFN